MCGLGDRVGLGGHVLVDLGGRVCVVGLGGRVLVDLGGRVCVRSW